MHKFGSNKDSGFKNYRTQNRAMADQTAKVTLMISILEPSWIETISVDICSRQVHQSQHNHGLESQTDLGKVIGKCYGCDIAKSCGTIRIPQFGGGNFRSGAAQRTSLNIVEIEQVFAKSKPVRGLCLRSRNHGPEAMKENGRNEDYPGNTAWRIPVQSTSLQ